MNSRRYTQTDANFSHNIRPTCMTWN